MTAMKMYKNLINMAARWGVPLAVATVLVGSASLWSGNAAAETEAEAPALESITYTTAPGKGLEFQLKLSAPAPEPTSFITKYPARVTFDLAKVANKLPWSVPLTIKGGGAAKTLTAVEASGRTRVVINLDKIVPYQARVEGNTIFVSLTDESVTGVGEQGAVEPQPEAAPKVEAPVAPVAQAEASSQPATTDDGRILLEQVDIQPLTKDRVQLKLKFSGPAPKPANFTITDPARIVMDFANTSSKLPWNSREVGVGSVRSLAVAEAGNRTRLVLNMLDLQALDTQISGNELVATVGAVAAVQQPRSRKATDEPAHQVKAIDFRRGEGSAGRLMVTLSDPNVTVDTREEGGAVVVELLNTSLPKELQRRLDVMDFATPIKYIDASAGDSTTRIAISATGAYDHLAYQSENVFTVEVKERKKEQVAELERKPAYTGEKLSLNFQDIEVRAVLQLIADFTSLNLVASDTVQGNLTLRMKNVPWDQALDIILKTKGLAMRREGNVIYVAPGEEVAAREKLELEAKKQVTELAPLRSELIQINYAKASEIAALLKSGEHSILSERGKVSVDERTNTLLVNDVSDKLVDIHRLVARLDIPVRQVMIDSRIVIAKSDFAKDLGVRFGVTDTRRSGNDLFMTSGTHAGTDTMAASALDNLATTASPYPIEVPTGTVGRNQRLNVNMPVAATEAGRIAFAILGSNTLLDLELSALQSEGRGEVISNPRVITANQKEALIEQGTEIPYREASNSGAATISFKKAVLSLKVRPQITPDNRIIMDLTVNKDSVGEVFQGVPSINTKEVNTQVLVNNGETVVLGGVYEQERLNQVKKVPLLGDLPVVGALFRSKSNSDDKSELLIFVTPKILNDAAKEGLSKR